MRRVVADNEMEKKVAVVLPFRPIDRDGFIESDQANQPPIELATTKCRARRDKENQPPIELATPKCRASRDKENQPPIELATPKCRASRDKENQPPIELATPKCRASRDKENKPPIEPATPKCIASRDKENQPPIELATTKCRASRDKEKEKRRLGQWRKMIGSIGTDWKDYVRKKPDVVKKRIRKGIPDCLRSLVWQLMSGSRELLLKHQGVYDQLVLYEMSASELDIVKDITRTFPTHVSYTEMHGPGQRSLFNVLKAYSVYDREVGYVQGMGFVAGFFLLYMSEEDAFWLMVAMLKGAVNPPMQGLYLPGLPLVQQYLFQFERLIKEHLPKLGTHFDQEMINPGMFASQWFVALFSNSLPFPLTARIWDVFLYEGVKIVFKVGLALLKYCQDDLVKLPFEKLLPALRNFPKDALNPDTLLPMACSIKVTKRLEELKQEYLLMNNQQSQYSKSGNKEQKLT